MKMYDCQNVKAFAKSIGTCCVDWLGSTQPQIEGSVEGMEEASN